MVYKYGIDFGTTNSSIALRFLGEDDAEHTIVVDVKDTLPHETLPSVILVDDAGHITVGEDAVRKYTSSKVNSASQQLIKQIKLDLERKGRNLCYNVARRRFEGVELIAAILRVLRQKAEAVVDELDIDVDGVVMGVPVEYGDIQKNVLRQALVAAGYYPDYATAEKKTEFVSEPVAVAIHYGLDNGRNSNVLVFDFGGGTLDLAIMQLQNQDGHDKPHKTLAKERLTLGGEELTRLFFKNSFCSKRKYGTRYISDKFGFESSITPDQLWEKLLRCEEGVRFISAIDRCKCDLSRAQTYRFSFIGRNIQFDEKVFYREDFSESISEHLQSIYDLVENCLESAGIDDPYYIDYVILAGGSSLIPAVQDLLVDKFGPMRVCTRPNADDKIVKRLKHNRASESEVMTSIVRGLAVVGSREKALVEDVVDSDYGVWDDGNNCFAAIVKKGMAVKNTQLNRITFSGTMDEFECSKPDATSIEVKVYQNNMGTSNHLGTINIPNPGGKKYRIYMQVDRQSGMLEVIFYDIVQKRWIDEIPLNERQYTLK